MRSRLPRQPKAVLGPERSVSNCFSRRTWPVSWCPPILVKVRFPRRRLLLKYSMTTMQTTYRVAVCLLCDQLSQPSLLSEPLPRKSTNRMPADMNGSGRRVRQGMVVLRYHIRRGAQAYGVLECYLSFAEALFPIKQSGTGLVEHIYMSWPSRIVIGYLPDGAHCGATMGHSR